jgi:CBS domain-containing protein
MRASDVMVTQVISVEPDSNVQDVAELLLTNRISAVPVVDDTGRLVGMVSEGDLIRRDEADTTRDRPWWLQLIIGRDVLAAEYVKEHSRRVADIMSRPVVSAQPDTPVADVATLLERHRIKRVPIVQDGKVVGIVSRANLIQALATFRKKVTPSQSVDDVALREKLLSRLKSEPWVRPNLLNVTVSDGIVDLWGIVDSSVEKQALRVAVETMPGVKAINDSILVRPVGAGSQKSDSNLLPEG